MPNVYWKIYVDLCVVDKETGEVGENLPLLESQAFEKYSQAIKWAESLKLLYENVEMSANRFESGKLVETFLI